MTVPNNLYIKDIILDNTVISDLVTNSQRVSPKKLPLRNHELIADKFWFQKRKEVQSVGY